MFETIMTQSRDSMGRHPGMTIGVALLSRRIAIVASDGRVMSPVPLGPDGAATTPAVIATDDEDKTFRAASGRIIGCCAGVMRLGGRRATELVAASVGEDRTALLDHAADRVGRALQVALLASDVSVQRRLVHALLVGRDGASLGLRHVMATGDSFSIEERLSFQRGSPARLWRVIGEDVARTASSSALDRVTNAQNVNLDSLRRTATQAVRAGINGSGPSPDNPDLPACGGTVRVATLFAP